MECNIEVITKTNGARCHNDISDEIMAFYDSVAKKIDCPDDEFDKVYRLSFDKNSMIIAQKLGLKYTIQDSYGDFGVLFFEKGVDARLEIEQLRNQKHVIYKAKKCESLK